MQSTKNLFVRFSSVKAGSYIFIILLFPNTFIIATKATRKVQRSLRSYGNYSSAIVATATSCLRAIWKPEVVRLAQPSSVAIAATICLGGINFNTRVTSITHSRKIIIGDLGRLKDHCPWIHRRASSSSCIRVKWNWPVTLSLFSLAWNTNFMFVYMYLV